MKYKAKHFEICGNDVTCRQFHLNEANWQLSVDPTDSVGILLKKAAHINEFSVSLLQPESPKIDEPMQGTTDSNDLDEIMNHLTKLLPLITTNMKVHNHHHQDLVTLSSIFCYFTIKTWLQF